MRFLLSNTPSRVVQVTCAGSSIRTCPDSMKWASEIASAVTQIFGPMCKCDIMNEFRSQDDARKRGEQHVDSYLHDEIKKFVDNPANVGGRVVIVTNDGNDHNGKTSFPKCISYAQGKKFLVDIYGFKSEMSSKLTMLDNLTVRVIDLLPSIDMFSPRKTQEQADSESEMSSCLPSSASVSVYTRAPSKLLPNARHWSPLPRMPTVPVTSARAGAGADELPLAHAPSSLSGSSSANIGKLLQTRVLPPPVDTDDDFSSCFPTSATVNQKRRK